jgi:hypothetical protein
LAEDWSAEEVSATVADYFAMLARELRDEPYNKREHNRRLKAVLRNRSAGSIEFKHANISAALFELGFPYIDGYKPRANYQKLLQNEVSARLDRDEGLRRAAERVVEAPVAAVPQVRKLAEILVPAPVRERGVIHERRALPPSPRRGINYLEREAKNSSLGAAGEEFALGVEHRRLWEGGHRSLAERIEHVSRTQGDGMGYDILSFEIDGRERLIEVKTTCFGAMTPFFASRREVATSEDHAQQFNLFRVFRFRETPQIFILPGSLRQSCTLDPVQFRVSLA